MSIHYDLYDTPDIQKKGEEQPLHPRVVFNGTIDQEEFLDRVHKFTGISRSLAASIYPPVLPRRSMIRPLHFLWLSCASAFNNSTWLVRPNLLTFT